MCIRDSNKRLARTHLVVADTSAIGFEHPYGILLTLIKVWYAQPFKVEVGKRLVRTVKIGTHKAIEKAVVTVRELLFERVRCPSEPVHKTLSDFLNLGVRHLCGMSVPYFDAVSYTHLRAHETTE